MQGHINFDKTASAAWGLRAKDSNITFHGIQKRSIFPLLFSFKRCGIFSWLTFVLFTCQMKRWKFLTTPSHCLRRSEPSQPLTHSAFKGLRQEPVNLQVPENREEAGYSLSLLPHIPGPDYLSGFLEIPTHMPSAPSPIILPTPPFISLFSI